jgi:phage baseplate assembly protein W
MNFSRKDFLGQGFAFPFQFTPSRQMALVAGEDDIAQAIRIILGTMPGERLMRPDFGCRVYDLVFESRDLTTARLMAQYVENALERWEPRIEVTSVKVDYTSYESALLAQISYIIKTTHDERSIIYPFYLMGEE